MVRGEERANCGKALIFTVVLFVTLAFVSIGCVSATLYTVFPIGCDYNSILAAIDVADPGDTIIVRDDTYTKNTDSPVFVEPKIAEGDWIKESGIRIQDGCVPYILMLDNGLYRIYYNNPDGIFSAISEDGINFTKERGVRLSGTGILGDPEWQAHGATVIRLDDGSYRMYYIGATGVGGPGHDIHRIYSAISSDGLNFTREGIRIESEGTIDDGWASVPEIVRTFDGRYRLYYCSMGAKSIASAISVNGLNFTREYGPGIGNGTGVYGADPAVCKLSSGTYWMFFTSPGGPMPPWYLEKGIYSARSTDGVNFTKDLGVRVSPGGVYDSVNTYDPTVISLPDGRFRMYYGGASDQGVITLSAVSPFATPVMVAIATDKYEYTTGDTMHLGLDVNNPGSAQYVTLNIYLDQPTGGTFTLVDTTVTLPAGLDYSNPDFKVFRLPSIPKGTYTWHAQLSDPVTDEIICEDTAEWRYVSTAATRGEMTPEEIAKEIEKVFEEMVLEMEEGSRFFEDWR